MTVLFIGAHADDIELSAGATCARLCAAGIDVRFIVATRESDPHTAGVRKSEAIAAAKALGVPGDHVYFLGLPDGHAACNRDTVTALRGLVSSQRIKPVAVFTHAFSDSHQDHVAVAQLTTAAFREVAILRYLVRNSAVVSGFAPSLRVPTGSFRVEKDAALAKHQSQVQAGRIPLDKVRDFERRFSLDGAPCEAFELELQEGAAAAVPLIAGLDGAPATQLWAPVLVGGRLTVVAGAAEFASPRRLAKGDATRDRPPTSLAIAVARLQAMLLETVPLRLGAAASSRVQVTDAAAFNAAEYDGGNLVLLGGPGLQSLAPELIGGDVEHTIAGSGCISLSRPGSAARISLGGDRRSARGLRQGVVTIAANPEARARGKRGFLIAAVGSDAQSFADAANALTESDAIAQLVGPALEVLSGRAAAVQIHVPRGGLRRQRPVATRAYAMERAKQRLSSLYDVNAPGEPAMAE